MAEKQSPFTLTSVSLRGIGSYLKGAMLEIRPLTIICGTNGSGKSTWFRALNILHDSPTPSVGLQPDHEEGLHGLLNASLDQQQFGKERPSPIWDECEENFGYPGTIGLKMSVAKECDLLGMKLHPKSSISLRISDPKHLCWNSEYYQNIDSRCELRVNGDLIADKGAIDKLLSSTFDGYYYLSSIRPIQVSPIAFNNASPRPNYVGACGQFAHAIHFDAEEKKVSGLIDNNGLNETVSFYDYYKHWLDRLLGINLSRLNGPEFGCFDTPFGNEFAPRNLSAGFHQIAPMLVQAGLMNKGEVFCIENPEVHLHPGLILKLTEFFIQVAKSGRNLVIETHSDLMIRRIFREILNEDSRQQMFAIYFVDTDKSGPNVSSKIEKIRLDSEGRVENWPKGFMDDDVEESGHLLDAMYGKRKSESEADDEI